MNKIANIINFIVFVCGLFFSTVTYGDLFGYDSYEDCILDSMKGIKSDVAANEIKNACRVKFPEKMERKEDKPLPKAEVEKIEGKGGIERDEFKRTTPSFYGSIENKTQDWFITRIKVVLYPEDEKQRSKLKHECDAIIHSPLGLGIHTPKKGSMRPYRGGIGPLMVGDFTCENVYAPEGVKFNWYIKSAYGYQ